MGMKTKIKRSAGSDVVYLLEAFDEFIAEKEIFNKSPSTIENYKTSFKFFCEFYGVDEETTTDEIKQSHFYKWIETMKLEGFRFSTINHYLRDNRAFFYWCMHSDRKYIEPEFKIQILEAQEEQIKLFTDEELELLLEKPKRNESFPTWRMWAIVNWVLGTGNRAATIVDVRIGDINFSKRDIALRHTKNKSAQIIPLSSSLETVLKEYIRMWRRDADADGFLFCNIGEEKLTTNALRQAFSKYCEDRGVKHTNIHGLRHNFAKGWVRNNGNMFSLQKILGHSTLEMTRKYVKLFSEDIKEDFDKFSPLDTIKRNSKRTHTIKRSEW